MSVPNVIDARDLIQLAYGAKAVIRAQESDTTVGTTAVKLGSYANTRIAVEVCNNGAAAIAIGFSNAVTSSTGIVVVANGFLQILWRDDLELVNIDIWAISASAGNSVHVVESVLQGL